MTTYTVRERCRFGEGQPMRVPGSRKARPAPAVTERAWAEMPTGRGGG